MWAKSDNGTLFSLEPFESGNGTVVTIVSVTQLRWGLSFGWENGAIRTAFEGITSLNRSGGLAFH